MTFLEWSKSNVDYGRKLVNSAVEGARIGEGKFSHDPLSSSCFGEAAQRAVCPAVIGLCLGALGGYLGDERRQGFYLRIPRRRNRLWRRRALGQPAFHCACRIERVEEH